MITQYFFFMWWQACRSSGSTGTPVDDSAWHTDVPGCPQQYQMALGWFREFLFYYIERYSSYNILIESLQGLEIDRLELTILYFASKSLKRSFRSENFALMSFLKFSKLRTSSISSSFSTDFLFVPFLIIIHWKIRYKLGKNDNGCKTMLTFWRSYRYCVADKLKALPYWLRIVH